MLRELANGAFLVHHHVDGLELSCAVDQVPMLLKGRPDDLELRLQGLQAQTRDSTPALPVASGWQWVEAGETEPIMVQPTGVRPRYRYCLESSAWSIFVAAGRAVVPRLSCQLRSEYLLRQGHLSAYEHTRAWVEAHLVPLIGGRPEGSDPLWRITRLDLAADIAGVRLTSPDLERFTTRARARGGFYEEASP